VVAVTATSTLEAPVKITPLLANLKPRSQNRRSWLLPMPCLRRSYPAMRLQVWKSIALKVFADTPCRKSFAHPASIWFSRRSS
jgi:hypothetical protein